MYTEQTLQTNKTNNQIRGLITATKMKLTQNKQHKKIIYLLKSLSLLYFLIDVISLIRVLLFFGFSVSK